MVIVLKCNNSLVTDWYMETIGKAIADLKEQVLYVNSIQEIYEHPKNTIIVAGRIMDAIRLYIKGYNRMIVWFQGVEPEESMMRHNSKIRYLSLSLIEKYVLKKAMFSFFVSNEMKEHYEKKYKIRFQENKFCVMPCQNTSIHKESFFKNDKYNNNYFCYVGSMAVWQKFEETVELYAKLEELGLPNTKLYVFTKEQDCAKKIIMDKGIENFEIMFIPNDELPEYLSDIKYGFIIREDTTVNRVATPTKISTYLSCGVIPIYSKCLADFASVASSMKYVVPYDDQIVNSINNFNTYHPESELVYNEYNNIFENYFDPLSHILEAKKKLQTII